MLPEWVPGDKFLFFKWRMGMKFSVINVKPISPGENWQKIRHQKSTTFFTPQNFKISSPWTSGTASTPVNPHPQNFGGAISPPKFWGWSVQNPLFYSVFWGPPPKFTGWNCHPLNLGGMGWQGRKKEPWMQWEICVARIACERRKVNDGH